MKRIFVLSIMILMGIGHSSCQRAAIDFEKDFKLMPKIIFTQEIPISYKELKAEFKKMERPDILKFISSDPVSIQFNYVRYNLDNLDDSIVGIGYYSYYALYSNDIGNYLCRLYLKTQFEDSSMVYLQICSKDGKCLNQFLLQKYSGEEPFLKGFYMPPSLIITCEYYPMDIKTRGILCQYNIDEKTAEIRLTSRIEVVTDGFFLDYRNKSRNDNDPLVRAVNGISIRP